MPTNLKILFVALLFLLVCSGCPIEDLIAPIPTGNHPLTEIDFTTDSRYNIEEYSHERIGVGECMFYNGVRFSTTPYTHCLESGSFLQINSDRTFSFYIEEIIDDEARTFEWAGELSPGAGTLLLQRTGTNASTTAFYDDNEFRMRTFGGGITYVFARN